MITYQYEHDAVVVKVEGKIAGRIKAVPGGFAYFPKGTKTHGEVLHSIMAVRRSLEAQ